MTITFPIALPTTRGMMEVTFRGKSSAAVSASPFSGEQQVYEHQGEWWEADVKLPPMSRADAEVWIAFLLKLRGIVGTFTMGDPIGGTPRGLWAGTPLVNGAHAVGARTIAMDGFTGATTGKEGDWIQFGTGTDTRLHKVVQDFTASGGAADVEIWPALKVALADNDAVTKADAKGLWRLLSNDREWTIRLAQKYGIAFACMEAF